MKVYVATYDWRPWGVFSSLKEAAKSFAKMNNMIYYSFIRVIDTDSFICARDKNVVILEMELDFDPYKEEVI